MKIKKIDTKTWKYFYIGDIFDCQTTQAMISPKDGNYNYVSRSAFNNGVSRFVDLKDRNGENFELNKGNCITIGAEGRIAFYQKNDFIAGVKVYTIRHTKLNEKIGLFLCSLLNVNATKYKYTEARILDKIKQETIPLPTTPDNQPDWKFMEEYMIKTENEVKENKKKLDAIIAVGGGGGHKIDTSTWKEFDLKDLFEISGSKTTSKQTLNRIGIGKYPYITTQATTNGINGYYNFYTEQGDCLTIDSAVLGTCFYQQENFSASDHVEILRPKFEWNKYVALFLVNILNNTGRYYNYSYLLKRSQKQLKQETIPLPTTPDGQPDWWFMEEYIKSLPYGDKI